MSTGICVLSMCLQCCSQGILWALVGCLTLFSLCCARRDCQRGAIAVTSLPGLAPAGRGAAGRTRPGPGGQSRAGQGEAARPRCQSSGSRSPRRERLVPGRAPQGLGGGSLAGLRALPCRARGRAPRPAYGPALCRGSAAPPMPYARSWAPAARAPARHRRWGYAGCLRPDYTSGRFRGWLARSPAPGWYCEP